MATAKPIFDAKPKVPDRVELTLSKDEALVLRAVLSRISGSSSKSRRELTDGINYALLDAGFVNCECSDMRGAIEIL